MGGGGGGGEGGREQWGGRGGVKGELGECDARARWMGGVRAALRRWEVVSGW